MRENEKYFEIAAQAVWKHTGTYPTDITKGPENSFWAQTFIVDGKYFVKMTNNPKKGENSMVEVPITQHLRRFGIPVALALEYFPEDAIADGYPVKVIYEYFGDISGRLLSYQGYSIAGVDKMVNNVNGYHQLGTTNIDFLPHYKLSQREMLFLINASNLPAGVKEQSLAAF